MRCAPERKSSASQVVVIGGASGTGKTAIVQELVYPQAGQLRPLLAGRHRSGSSTVASDPVGRLQTDRARTGGLRLAEERAADLRLVGLWLRTTRHRQLPDVGRPPKPQLDAHC